MKKDKLTKTYLIRITEEQYEKKKILKFSLADKIRIFIDSVLEEIDHENSK